MAREVMPSGVRVQVPPNLLAQWPDLLEEGARDLGGISHGICDRQLVALRVEQIDRKRLELRDARDELGNFLQQLFEIEHRRDLAAEREERGQRFECARANVWFWCSGGFGHGEARV